MSIFLEDILLLSSLRILCVFVVKKTMRLHMQGSLCHKTQATTSQIEIKFKYFYTEKLHNRETFTTI